MQQRSRTRSNLVVARLESTPSPLCPCSRSASRILSANMHNKQVKIWRKWPMRRSAASQSHCRGKGVRSRKQPMQRWRSTHYVQPVFSAHQLWHVCWKTSIHDMSAINGRTYNVLWAVWYIDHDREARPALSLGMFHFVVAQEAGMRCDLVYLIIKPSHPYT